MWAVFPGCQPDDAGYDGTFFFFTFAPTFVACVIIVCVTFVFDDSQEVALEDDELEELQNKVDAVPDDAVSESTTDVPREIMNIENLSWRSILKKRYVKCLLSAIFLAVG